MRFPLLAGKAWPLQNTNTLCNQLVLSLYTSSIILFIKELVRDLIIRYIELCWQATIPTARSFYSSWVRPWIVVPRQELDAALGALGALGAVAQVVAVLKDRDTKGALPGTPLPCHQLSIIMRRVRSSPRHRASFGLAGCWCG